MPDILRPQPSALYCWSALVFISLAVSGSYYIYDGINPLERIFVDHLGFSATQFGWLNASYSVAVVATLLIGAIIVKTLAILARVRETGSDSHGLATITRQRVPADLVSNLPIYEDCESKFGIGLKAVTRMEFNPEQAKDF
jgi:hypothetical protein